MSTRAADTSIMRAGPLEVAAGWIHGLLPETLLPKTHQSPREALDDAMLPALVDGPCHITFSGGRDSSAVLAAATALARREGLALPIPVTRSYPAFPESDEEQWQRLVVDHLQLPDWVRIEFTNETELLASAARTSLVQDGVVWPPAIHTHTAVYERLDGGSLMTGEGGDAVLGPRRGSAISALRSGRRRNRRLFRAAGESLLPTFTRRMRLKARYRLSLHARWLTPAALEMHVAKAVDDDLHEPLRYDAGTWFLRRRRSWSVLAHNHAVIASRYGLRTFEPLLDPGFLAALAAAGGRWGFPGRTATMRALFSDVLPDKLLARNTKASFNRAYTGEATREFARNWDGSGVDPELVDPERLRAVWLSDEPTMATGLLLHTAWLVGRREEL